jgi:CheY-like chemotaxis protein
VLVLCDMWLGDGANGIDVLRRLAALPVPPVAAILVSGDTRPETLRAAGEAGYPLLHKPVSPAKLRAIVMHYAWKLRKPTPVEPVDEDPAG